LNSRRQQHLLEVWHLKNQDLLCNALVEGRDITDETVEQQRPEPVTSDVRCLAAMASGVAALGDRVPERDCWVTTFGPPDQQSSGPQGGRHLYFNGGDDFITDTAQNSRAAIRGSRVIALNCRVATFGSPVRRCNGPEGGRHLNLHRDDGYTTEIRQEDSRVAIRGSRVIAPNCKVATFGSPVLQYSGPEGGQHLNLHRGDGYTSGLRHQDSRVAIRGSRVVATNSRATTLGSPAQHHGGPEGGRHINLHRGDGYISEIRHQDSRVAIRGSRVIALNCRVATFGSPVQQYSGPKGGRHLNLHRGDGYTSGIWHQDSRAAIRGSQIQMTERGSGRMCCYFDNNLG
jgi:hypothetical protein